MKPLTFAILRMLSDGNFHSGTTLGQALNVSRASISGALQDLGNYGLTIHKIPGRGYHWLNPVQWLDSAQIYRHLADHADSVQIEIADIVESTNSLLLQRAVSQAASANRVRQVLAAELQTQGRGRRGRSWSSGLGDSLTFSVLWPSQCAVNALSGLSLATGVAIVRALKRIGISDVSLKWPNDVLSSSSKLAGILIELHGDMLSPGTVIIGIGLNLKLSSVTKDRVDQKITDIASVTGKMPDRNQLLAVLLKELIGVLDIFEQHGFEPFAEEWVQCHAYQNKAVQIRFPDGSSRDGIATGVAPDGALLVNTPEGIVQLRSGEISLRGLA
ncbi:biotin--[acetyl-CoA-carboxylase] ligase [Nitrosomonas sp.]|uniref:biotin--[acetyl-CoA-carboxylase] ligase n=1 Tax=Nitrosomonas sp. TaxID=42353 RepID=UPI0025CF764A|nr:biotin--[acetyl-CoA-carboxylase] ligase [Nitrosomonas sp.]MCC6917419.1 biotin--[acetyl-CoA-carboxylase] ligase [Nitrosomonas sp.]